VVVVASSLVVVLVVLGVHQPPVAKAYHVPEGLSWMMQGSGKLTARSGVLVRVVGRGRRRIRRR
jgi:hypothetical protein